MADRYGGARKKKSWKAFLRPGWVLSLVAIIAFSYFSFTLLAPWQLDKDDAIVQRNEQIDASFQVDPVPVAEVQDPADPLSPEDEWTRVVLEGQYLSDAEVLLRIRPVDTSPAFQSLVPFQLDSGETLLVHRGWVVPGEGNRVPEFADPPTGPMSLVGHLRADEMLPNNRPLEDEGYTQIYGINAGEISEVTGLDIAPYYVQLSEGQAGVLHPMPVPQLERGSHLSYGFQWIAFGIMAPLGLGYFIWAELRERRRVKAEEQELNATVGTDTGGRDEAGEDTGSASEAASEAAAGGQEKVATDPGQRMRSRYGDGRPDHYRKFARRERQRF